MSRIRSFLSERFGWPQYLKPFMEKPLPEHLGWSVTLGSVLVLLFVVEAVTGMFLAMYYTPSPESAYQAVSYITAEVFMGGILRGIHHWGAGAMVVLVFAHLASSFFSGSFKPPREVTWVVGVCLFLLVLGFGFTGYLLPWDQKAYWATVVGSNIPRDLPFIGNFITRLLLAGDTVSGLTLSRFYALHTLMLPALTVLCIAVHIYMVRIHGISDHQASSHAPVRMPQDSAYHFFPEHLARASLVFTGVFILVLTLAVFGEIPMEEIAGTVDPDYLPRPEWYYMWLFQLLTFFSGRTEIIGSLVIPIGSLILLFWLPFLSRSPLKKPADRPVATAVGVACMVAVVYLSIMGMANSKPYGEFVRLPDKVLTASETEGLKVFADRECAYCHHILGGGGRREGPDLSNVAAKDRSKDWLIQFIRDPQSVSRWSIMPKYDLTPETLNGLADFILALDFSAHEVKTVTRKEILENRTR